MVPHNIPLGPISSRGKKRIQAKNWNTVHASPKPVKIYTENAI